jgi:transglutaminase-like putative cysteine protease
MSRLLRPAFLSFIFLGAIAGLFTYSLTEAEWVSHNNAHIAGVWLGLLCGLTLTAVRWRGWQAGAYSLALSIITAGEAVGRVLPSITNLQSQTGPEIVWLMHVQLLTLFDRGRGWLTAYLRGEGINDTGLFVFLLVVSAWQASAWLAWCLRRRQALAGLLPYGFLLALNVHLSGQAFGVFWSFVVGAVLLVALTAYWQHHADWDARHLDYPLELGYDWGGSALGVTLVIGLLAGIAPLAGTPKGWRTLSDLFRVARLRTADTAEQLFSGVNPPALGEPLVTARTPNLASIGTPIDRGDETIMWVIVSDPAPPPPQAHAPEARLPKHYWRSGLFATYTGTGWEPVEFPPLRAVPEFPAPLPGRYALRQHYEIIAPHSETLFAVNWPTASNVELRYVAADESAAVFGSATAYDVTSWATQLTAGQLQSAAIEYPVEIREKYLQLPAELPQRVRALAARVTAGASTPYAKALRLQTYLRATYPYSLDVPPPPVGHDAVDYFLFEAPGGFCAYYASAMAVMLRVVGVPARVVTGYATGDYDYPRGAWRVPASAAHAWVEVYFPEYSWVEFEPTAAQAEFVYESESQPVAAGASGGEPVQPAGGKILVWVMLALGVSVLVGIALAARWASRTGSRTPRERAQVLYRRVRRGLAFMGLVASPSVTPSEFLAAVAPQLNQKLQTALEAVTQVYVRALFSPRAPTAAETQAAQRLWAWRAWLKLFFQRRLW